MLGAKLTEESSNNLVITERSSQNILKRHISSMNSLFEQLLNLYKNVDLGLISSY